MSEYTAEGPIDHEVQDESDPCGHPCPSSSPCSAECSDYWDRMRHEGFWQDVTGWTDKGIREMLK